MWIAGCLAVAVVVGWALPASWDGAGLRQVLLFTPDIGHTAVTVIVLACAVAIARTVLTIRALTSRRGGVIAPRE